MNRLNQNQAIAWAANGLNPMEVAPLASYATLGEKGFSKNFQKKIT